MYTKCELTPNCNRVRLCVYVCNSVDVAPSNPLPPPPFYFVLFTVKDLVVKQHPTTMYICMYVCVCVCMYVCVCIYVCVCMYV